MGCFVYNVIGVTDDYECRDHEIIKSFFNEQKAIDFCNELRKDLPILSAISNGFISYMANWWEGNPYSSVVNNVDDFDEKYLKTVTDYANRFTTDQEIVDYFVQNAHQDFHRKSYIVRSIWVDD